MNERMSVDDDCAVTVTTIRSSIIVRSGKFSVESVLEMICELYKQFVICCLFNLQFLHAVPHAMRAKCSIICLTHTMMHRVALRCTNCFNCMCDVSDAQLIYINICCLIRIWICQIE